MKHVKAGFGILTALLLWGLLFSACTNMFVPPGQGEERGGLTIRIAGGQSSIRTLYPTAEFTKYRLEFSGGGPSHSDVVLTGGETSVVLDDLAAGEWTITAKGYVTIDVPDAGPTEFEAARGSKTVTVGGGSAALTIDLSADMASGSGYFSWDIHIPGDAGIQEAGARITRLSDNSPVAYVDLLSTPESRQGIMVLSAGYYLVQLWVSNGYQRIGRTEVAAVYSGMETTANYTFTGADFVPAVKMSGTVNLTGTAGVERINIMARQSNGQSLWSNVVTVDDGDGPYTWEIYTAAPGTPSTVSFSVQVIYTDHTSITVGTGTTITLDSSGQTGIDLGAVSGSAVAIWGTIHFTGITQAPDYVHIYINAAGHSSGSQVTLGTLSGGAADGIWSMKVPVSLAGSGVEFHLGIQTGETYFDRNLGTVPLPSTNSPISFPTVNLATNTWSGTINLTVNGAFPSGNVTIAAYDTSDDSWQYIGSGQVQSGGAWSISFGDPYPGTKTISFRLSVNNSMADLGEERNLPGTTQGGIFLGSHSYVTLSGSAEVILNGSPITSGDDYSINVNAYEDPDYFGGRLGNAYVNPSGIWGMLVESSPSPRNFYFEVSVYKRQGGASIWKGTGISRTVSDSPISDIALSIVFNVITLSGTVSGTVDGNPPDDCMVAAYIAGDNKVLGSTGAEPGGAWSLVVDAPDSSKTVSFVVAPVTVDGDNKLDFTIVRLPSMYNRTVYNSDVSGINLTGLSLTTKTVTVNITSDGTAPVPGMVYVFDSAVDMNDMMQSGENMIWLKGLSFSQMEGSSPPLSTWSLKVPGDTGSAYFFVMTESGGYVSSSAVSLPGATPTVPLNLSNMIESPF
jgi:hypothetical protein